MKIKNIVLCIVALGNSIGVYASDEKNIALSPYASYYDEKIIPSNIRSECSELGRQFSESTKESLESEGWVITMSSEVGQLAKGTSMKLQITNALSSGNAFRGHKKMVSIAAELYKDGKLIDTYSATRDSGGGIGAGFMSSCAVLQRCVNTLGNDVAKWLKKKSMNSAVLISPSLNEPSASN